MKDVKRKVAIEKNIAGWTMNDRLEKDRNAIAT